MSKSGRVIAASSLWGQPDLEGVAELAESPASAGLEPAAVGLLLAAWQLGELALLPASCSRVGRVRGLDGGGR